MAQNSHSLSPNGHSELSAEEFQKKLLDWFEDRGILSELRSHLRHQMVAALKDTKLGTQTMGNFRQAGSPKLQAINLLVAEFLLQQEYHYTLSVFTSEVPLLRNLPEFTAPLQSSVKGLSTSFGNKGYPRFQQRDVHDILEAVGLSPNSEEGAVAYRLYENSREEPLLNCIIRCLPEVVHSKMKKKLSEKSVTDFSNKGNGTSVGIQNSKSEQSLLLAQYKLFTSDMKSILLQSSLNSELLEQLHEQLKRLLEKEILQVREEEAAKFQEELLHREHRIQMELVRHEEEIHQKLSEAEEHLAGQRRNIDENLDLKQKHLANLATQLHQQQADVSQRLREVESELLKQRERELEEMKEEDSTMASKKSSEIKLLEEELNRLRIELETQDLIKNELEDNRQKLMEASQALLESQAEVIFLRNLQRQCAQLHMKQDHGNLSRENSETVEQCTEAVPLAAVEKTDEYQQTNAVEYTHKGLQTQQSEATKMVERERLSKEIDQRAMYEDVIRHLHQENSDLRERIEQQSVRIQELTVHAAQLANQLENVQAGMDCAAFQLHHLPPPAFHASQSASTSAAPVVISRQQDQFPPPPPMLPKFGEHASTSFNSKQLGAGEELGLSSETHPSMVNQPRPSPPQRESRRKPPRRLMVHNSTSSDESSPTDEILREARRRLRKLEEESEDVDRRYHEFRLRHSDSLAAATASLLFHPVLSSPIPSHQTTVFNQQPLSTPTRGTPSLFTYRPDLNRGRTLYPVCTRYDSAAVVNRTEIQAARIAAFPSFSFSQTREPTVRYSLNSHVPYIGTESFASQTLLQSRLSEISNVNRFSRASSDIFVPPLSSHQPLRETLFPSSVTTNGQQVHHSTNNTFSKSSATDKIRAQCTDSSSRLGTQQQQLSCSSSQLLSSAGILTVPSVQSAQLTNVYDTPRVSSVIKDTQQTAPSQISVLQNESQLPATDQGQPLRGIETTNVEIPLNQENRVSSYGLTLNTVDSAFTLSQTFIPEIPRVVTNAPLNESLVSLERNSEKYYSALEVVEETDSPDPHFENKIPEQECDSSRVDEGSSRKENKISPADNSDATVKEMVKELVCHGKEPPGEGDTICNSPVKNNKRRIKSPIVDTNTEALLNTFIPVRDSDQVLVSSFTPSEKFSDGNLGLAVASAPLQKVSFSSSDTSSDLPISVGKESTKGDDSW
ncbi:centriole and centriolar satellite protein ofd1 isoform X2 [Anabrus simplex]|uniref:centriole and centriolar satellite protein ofd1 isoform X2 n=1 Tax=Anabrus simplex TaxID=316456 RepID=UPI0035A2A264